MEQSLQIQALSAAAGCTDPDYDQTSATVVAQLASAGLTEGSARNGNVEGFDETYGGEHQLAEEVGGGAENVDPDRNRAQAHTAKAHTAKGAGTASTLDRERFEALPTSTRGRVTFETVRILFVRSLTPLPHPTTPVPPPPLPGFGRLRDHERDVERTG